MDLAERVEGVEVTNQDKRFIRESFGLAPASQSGFPLEKRAVADGEPARKEGKLVPCNRLGCWFLFRDICQWVAKALGQKENYAAELVWQLLVEFEIFEFYRDVGSKCAAVEEGKRSDKGAPLRDPTIKENVVIGCCWKPPPGWMSLDPPIPTTIIEQASKKVVKTFFCELPKLLHQLKRLECDHWLRINDLHASTQNVTTGEGAADAMDAALELLRTGHMAVAQQHIGATPRLGELLAVLEKTARHMFIEVLKGLNQDTSGLGDADVPHLVMLVREAKAGFDLSKMMVSTSAIIPTVTGEGGYDFFSSFFDALKLDDMRDYAKWINEVKQLLWNNWANVRFIYRSCACSGHTQDIGASVVIDKQELSGLLKKCKVVGPHNTNCTISDVDLLFVNAFQRYTEEISVDVKQINMLGFLDCLVRVSVDRHGKNSKSPKAELPGTLAHMLDNHIFKYMGDSNDDEEMTIRFIEAPSTKAVMAELDEQLRHAFDSVAKSDLRTDSPTMSIPEWLKLFDKAKGALPKIRRGYLLTSFALSQEVNDLDDNPDDHDYTLAGELNFTQFGDALVRVAIKAMVAPNNDHAKMLADLDIKLPAFIKALASAFPKRPTTGGEGTPRSRTPLLSTRGDPQPTTGSPASGDKASSRPGAKPSSASKPKAATSPDKNLKRSKAVTTRS